VKSQCEELQTKATKIASLEVDILTKSMQVCCLQGTNESQNEKINTLQQKIENFEDKITDLKADIVGKVREIARLKCDAKKSSKKLESKKAQIISLAAEVKEKTDKIKQLEAKRIMERNSFSDEVAYWKVLVQARDSEVATLRTDLLKKEEELQVENDHMVDLCNDILTKDVLIDSLTEMTNSQKLNNHRKIESIGKNDSLSSSISLD